MTSFIGRLARVTTRYRADASGNVAIVFALMGVVLMLAIGAAVDIGRWLNARDQTIAAIDAAVLAGGRSLQTNSTDKAAAVAAAQKYYDENVTSRLPVVDDSVTFSREQRRHGHEGVGHGLHQDALPALCQHRQAAAHQHLADRLCPGAGRSRRQRRQEHRGLRDARHHRFHGRPEAHGSEGCRQGSGRHRRPGQPEQVHRQGRAGALLDGRQCR